MYQSRRIAKEIGQLPVGSIILFEQRALDRQRGNRAIVVMDGAELLARVHLKHGSLYGEVHVGILKAIQGRRLTERGKSLGIMGAHPLRRSHSINKITFLALTAG